MARVAEMPETGNQAIRPECPKVHFQVADALAVRLADELEAHRHSDHVVTLRDCERLEAEELEVRKTREEAWHSVAATPLLELLEVFAAPVVLPRNSRCQAREDRRDNAHAKRLGDRFHCKHDSIHGSGRGSEVRQNRSYTGSAWRDSIAGLPFDCEVIS